MSFREVSSFTKHFPGFPAGTSDEGLVLAYQEDPRGAVGRQAVALLLGRYRKQVLIWCGRYVRDRERALDLAQEILLRAYSNLADYHEQEKFSAWLFIITRNYCLSELRRKKLPLAEPGVLDFLADPGQSPAEVLEEKMVVDEFRSLVCSVLTRQERDALWMRCFEAMPVDAITHQLGISGVTGARAILQKARRKLRRALEDKESSRRKAES
jgi:RNA polymerase sigma-70 factor, ECF subfamily